MANETASINISDEDDGQLSSNEDDNQINQNQKFNSNSKCNEIANNLFKWTNYIHGWQERYIVLKDGVLSYYKSQTETQYGCRGAIALKQSLIIPHDLDDCRFDIRVNDCCWYLRANTVEERQKWLEILEEHRSESGYGSQTSLRRHGSLLSINSTASLSVQSTGSYKRAYGLKEKLEEMETFKDILCRQVETLQTYFDACANSLTKGFEPYHKEIEKKLAESDDESLSNEVDIPKNNKPKELNRARLEDHAAMAIDFKGEAYTFKATTAGILHNLSHCIELMQQREEFFKKKLDREIEKRKKYEEQVKELSKDKKQPIIIAGPDFEEGPHSNIKEEQFFDAIDSTLDTLEQEEERRVQAFESLTKLPDLKPVLKHRLSEEIEKIVQEHLKFDLVDDLNSNVWELVCSDGEMKVYRRELEENGIVLDPLKAVHSVKGVTGHEICKYFWDPAVRMEWEGTLDSSRMIEALSDDTLIFNQVHKRVWPAAQRDTCFWSHIRSIKKQNLDLPDWIVVNYSTTHDLAPIKEPIIRAWANVAMICTTLIINEEKFKDKVSVPRNNLVCKITYVAQDKIRAIVNVAMICETQILYSNNKNNSFEKENNHRNDISCKITYVAFINPGGWAPANVLRTVYKREYPKFLKRFTQYVIDKTADKPILY